MALEMMGRSNRKIRLEKYEPNEGDMGLLSGSLISLRKIQNSLDDPASHSVRWPSSLTPSLCPPLYLLNRYIKNTTFKLVPLCYMRR